MARKFSVSKDVGRSLGRMFIIEVEHDQLVLHDAMSSADEFVDVEGGGRVYIESLETITGGQVE